MWCSIIYLLLLQVTRAIIIDSRWKKAKTLLQHPSLAGVRRVKLQVRL